MSHLEGPRWLSHGRGSTSTVKGITGRTQTKGCTTGGKRSPGNDPGCRTGEQANGLLCPSLDVSKGTLCDCDQNFEELVMEREGVG